MFGRAKEVGRGMEETSEGSSEDMGENILIVMAHRFEDLAVPVAVAKVAKCYKCENECPISPATLQTIVARTKKYQVICSRCAAKDERFQKDAQYTPFTPQQLVEINNTLSLLRARRGGAG